MMKRPRPILGYWVDDNIFLFFEIKVENLTAILVLKLRLTCI